MADIVQPMRFEIDIKSGLVAKPQRTILMKGDKNANRIIVALTEDGKPLDLTGVTVTGNFVRPPDGANVMLSGEASGNEASVTLIDQCYTTDGYYEASVILTMGDVRRTILSISGTVHSAGSGAYVDVGNVIPSVDEIVAQYATMKEVTEQTQAAKSAAATAATTATAAAKTANDAASAANTAAAGANGWAKATMTATGLPAGSAPTASVATASDGHKVITVGIPKGDTGAPATHSWDGTVLTITSGSGTSSADLKGPKGDPGVGAAWLVGSTDTITPAAVAAALAEERDVLITHAVPGFGQIAFSSFNWAGDLDMVGASITATLDGLMGICSLVGSISGGTWTVSMKSLDKFPNPNALTFTGRFNGTYDGSSPVTVTIPTALKSPYALTFAGAVTGTYDGSAAKTITIPTTAADSDKLGGVAAGSYPTKELIWENASPTSNFAAQTISLAASSYNYYAVISCSGSSNNFTIVRPGKRAYMMGFDGPTGRIITGRDVYVNDTGSAIQFADSKRRDTYGGDGVVNNDELIPYRIYGLNL